MEAHVDRGTIVDDLCRVADARWPEQYAEPWDQVGLVAGSRQAPLRKLLLALDPVQETVEEAIAWGADALLVHHPLLLHGVHQIAAETAKGAVLTPLIQGSCALYTAHTNADAPRDGVSAVLADALGLQDARPLDPAQHDALTGIGRRGVLAGVGMSLREFASHVERVLPKVAGGIRVAGDPQTIVREVALCGGAGDSLLEHPLVASADVYVTSDLRHHRALDTRETARAVGFGPALIDVSHWAAESLWLGHAAKVLSAQLPGVEVRVSERRTDPWTFAVGSGS